MTLSSLRAAKCSGLFEDSPRGNVSCGRITIKFAQCELDCSVRICKNRVRSSNNLYGSYGVQMSKIQTIKRLILSKCAVQVRTSTDRTGCTNFFREKNALFTDRGGQAAQCLQNHAPCGHRAKRYYVLHQSTQSGNSVFFCFLPEYTENFARRAKKRQNCNGKRKTPSPIADMQRQGPEKSD